MLQVLFVEIFVEIPFSVWFHFHPHPVVDIVVELLSSGANGNAQSGCLRVRGHALSVPYWIQRYFVESPDLAVYLWFFQVHVSSLFL